jgi:hypothetical protein
MRFVFALIFVLIILIQVSGALICSGTQIAVANLRKKDDWLNHFAGGVALGCMTGLYSKCLLFLDLISDGN